MPHVFGKSISFSFTPIVDSEPVKVDSLVSARIFSDTPTDAQIDTPATSGYIGSPVTTWTSKGNYEKLIEFAALTDSEPRSQDDYETYYVVVNFKYDSGGATVAVLEAIDVFRPDGLTSKITTRFDDVYAVNPKYKNHFTIADINVFINEAVKDIFRWYKGLGYPPKSLIRMSELNDACKYRAACKCDLSLKWWEDLKEHKEAYLEALKCSQPLAADSTGENASETPSGGTVYMMR